MWFLAVITGALLRWPTLAMLALRRVVRLASHPVLFAKTSHLFPDEYLARLNPEIEEAEQWAFTVGTDARKSLLARFGEHEPKT